MSKYVNMLPWHLPGKPAGNSAIGAWLFAGARCRPRLAAAVQPRLRCRLLQGHRRSAVLGFSVKAKLNNDPAKPFQCCVWSQPRATCSRNPILLYFWEKEPLLPLVLGGRRLMLQHGCWPWLVGSGASRAASTKGRRSLRSPGRGLHRPAGCLRAQEVPGSPRVPKVGVREQHVAAP